MILVVYCTLYRCCTIPAICVLGMASDRVRPLRWRCTGWRYTSRGSRARQSSCCCCCPTAAAAVVVVAATATNVVLVYRSSSDSSRCCSDCSRLLVLRHNPFAFVFVNVPVLALANLAAVIRCMAQAAFCHAFSAAGAKVHFCPLQRTISFEQPDPCIAHLPTVSVPKRSNPSVEHTAVASRVLLVQVTPSSAGRRRSRRWWLGPLTLH